MHGSPATLKTPAGKTKVSKSEMYGFSAILKSLTGKTKVLGSGPFRETLRQSVSHLCYYVPIRFVYVRHTSSLALD